MMKHLTLIFCLHLFSILPAWSQSQPAGIPVTILGTHHFANPGADAFNIHQDDIKAPKRQEEVLALVDRLVRFRPTKVLIEAPYGDSTDLRQYRAYLEHRRDDSLTRNEKQQLGFRIAARLDHAAIHPFDYRQNMDLSELEQLAQEDPAVGARLQALMQEIGALIEGVDRQLQEQTIAEFLHFMNLPESVMTNHQIYLRMLALTGPGTYGASRAVADWYGRNIRMFYNVNRIADLDDPEERLLIIVGQGHKQILRDLIEDAPYYHYVPVLEYLENK